MVDGGWRMVDGGWWMEDGGWRIDLRGQILCLAQQQNMREGTKKESLPADDSDS
jgi:hypothetical protein